MKVSEGEWTAPKYKAGFCCNDSWRSSEDSTTSIRTVFCPSARGASRPDCARELTATNATIAHNADVRRKTNIGFSVSQGIPRFPCQLWIFRGGRRLRGVRILLCLI